MTNAICLRAVQFRSTVEPGDGRTMEGYAAVFGTPARIQSWEGEFDEEIAAGAFRKTLRNRTPVLQFDHGRDMRTGTVPIGQIQELNEDADGLFVRAALYDNPVVEPIRQAIEGQSIDGMSIRFQVSREEWRDNQGTKVKPDELPRLLWEPGDRGPLKRTILEIDPLFELGPVVFPAYDSTSVGVRSLLAGLDPDDRRLLVRELAPELRPAARSVSGTDVAVLQALLTRLAAADAAFDPIAEAIASADCALDDAMATIAAALGVDNPDPDADAMDDQQGDGTPAGAPRSARRPQTFTGRPAARSAGGGDEGRQPPSGAAAHPETQARLVADGEALRLRGILT